MENRVIAEKLANELREKYNPEGSALRRNQMELLQILQFLADICDRNGIQWWLSSGTLLGAARHGGFIPWDDDIDIVLLRKDFKKLEKILYKLDSKEYVYQSMKSDPEYVNVYGKFRKREGRVKISANRYNYLRWRGQFIDIFSIEKTNYRAARIAKVVYHNLQHATSYIKWKCPRIVAIKFLEFLCLGVVNTLLRLVGLFNPNEEYHYSLGSGWPKHTFYMKNTFPLSKAKFEGIEFPVPHDMDAYLTDVYGDWRRMPSEEEIRKSIHSQEYIEEIYGERK
jgi:lipopolysaccharide cholinephosphotransferase